MLSILIMWANRASEAQLHWKFKILVSQVGDLHRKSVPGAEGLMPRWGGGTPITKPTGMCPKFGSLFEGKIP